jgi:hypothetical protein
VRILMAPHCISTIAIHRSQSEELWPVESSVYGDSKSRRSFDRLTWWRKWQRPLEPIGSECLSGSLHILYCGQLRWPPSSSARFTSYLCFHPTRVLAVLYIFKHIQPSYQAQNFIRICSSGTSPLSLYWHTLKYTPRCFHDASVCI